MTFAIFLALLGYTIVSAVTPGPNNFMLLASGVNFGFRRTIPHMLGICFGMVILLACIGLGFAQLFERYPAASIAIKVIGASYMIFLAYKIANSGPLKVTEGLALPMNFIQAALFQWVNPKAWIVGVVAISTYTSQNNNYLDMLIVIIVFLLVTLPSVALWAGFGTGLQRFLSNPKTLTKFNIAMAFVLVASLWPMLR